MLALIYPITLGLERIETSYLLKQNGVLQYLTGLSAYPNPTTLRRFVLRITSLAIPKIRKLHELVLYVMIPKTDAPTQVVFDLDSTVLILCGRQKMARVGYNPKKRGRPPYHHLLGFNGLTKDFWHGELRPGDAHTATGVFNFLKASFGNLPPWVKSLTIRADKGFYDRKIIEYLESEKDSFAIVIKLTRPIKAKLSTLSYQTYILGIETAEFFFQPTGWEKEYRFALIGRTILEDPLEQLTPFSMGQYIY